MKLKFFNILLFFNIFSNVEMNLQPKKFAPVKVAFVLGATSKSVLEKQKEALNLKSIAQSVSKDFSFSGQFNSDIFYLDSLPKKSDLKKWYDQGYGFTVALSFTKEGDYQLILYDNSEQEAFFATKVQLEGEVPLNYVSHKISDQIFPNLTSKKTSFSSLIAACKKEQITQKKYVYHIYLFYPSEFENRTKIVSYDTLNIAPRWSQKYPLLYYSQHTPTNVRLASVNALRQNRVVTNFDGLNMTPAFSKNGSVVVSLTQNGYGVLCKYEFDNKRKKGSYVSLTSPHYHAVSPDFIGEDKIVFCMIENKKPRIAILDLQSKKIEKITNVFSTSPSYSSVKNSVAYCKKVNGLSQVFSYNLKTKEDKQLTFSNFNKDECFWSGCGNYIVFSQDKLKYSQIACINLVNNKVVTLTPINEHWCYPNWSPAYDEVFL